MRKIRITESQWKTIVESELGYPLDTTEDNPVPDNAAGIEVGSDIKGKYVPDSMPTTADKYSTNRTKRQWFGINTSYGRGAYRMEEGKELDNAQNSGYGVKADAQINSIASNGGGKMAVNVSAEVNSNTRGSRNNTNQVRISRMEDAKKNDPATYQKNGGDRMLSILKSQVKKNSDKANASNERKTEDSITPQTGTTEKKNKQNNGVYYFV